jgi:membrane protein YdbS with pleckstrin-like domain
LDGLRWGAEEVSGAVDQLFASTDLNWHGVSAQLVTERRVPLAAVGAVGVALLGLAGFGSGMPVGARTALIVGGAGLLVAAAVGWFVVVPRIVRSWRYAERQQDLLVSHGRLFKRLTVVPYGRMQVIEVSAGPVAARLGIATVTLVTASASTDAKIPGVPAEVAHQLRDRLAAKGEALTAGL